MSSVAQSECLINVHTSLSVSRIYSFLVAQTVKKLPAMQETRVQSLGQEDPLEEGMAAHFSVHAWRVPMKEEPGGLPYLVR